MKKQNKCVHRQLLSLKALKDEQSPTKLCKQYFVFLCMCASVCVGLQNRPALCCQLNRMSSSYAAGTNFLRAEKWQSVSKGKSMFCKCSQTVAPMKALQTPNCIVALNSLHSSAKLFGAPGPMTFPFGALTFRLLKLFTDKKSYGKCQIMFSFR